jgi:hypothetical protein
MGRYVVKLADKYLEWSTVVDAPITDGMTLEEFTSFYKEKYGSYAMEFEFPKRMERVEQFGISAYNYNNVDELIAYNRAGPEEICLTKEELIKEYCNHEE